MDLELHYDDLWSKSIQAYEQGRFHLDYWLDRKDDDRFGITLLLRPGESVKKNIQKILTQLQSIEPHQYYYPASDIHLTGMSIISCYSGFQLEQIRIDDYRSLLTECIKDISPFSIHFKGVTASDSCIMIQGFPQDDQLDQLRDLIRQKFRKAKLENSLDKRYTLKTAHLTVLRYRTPLQHPKEWIQQIAAFRDSDFGLGPINQMELVFNDWYQRTEKVKKLHVFEL
jgi:2'-5' RNA ligase